MFYIFYYFMYSICNVMKYFLFEIFITKASLYNAYYIGIIIAIIIDISILKVRLGMFIQAFTFYANQILQRSNILPVH